jgi:glycosyltransferase involved in cell wall biosynthesis
MHQSPVISIVTPTFNHQNFIAPCIDSVLAQSYSNWEQIIIDDGSTDRTGEIGRRYDDPRVRYMYQQNQGLEALAHTYNRALAMAKGTLVAVLEGDDVWPADKLERMVQAFVDPEVVLAYGEMREIDPDGNIAQRMSNTSRKRKELPGSILFNDPVHSAAAYMLTVHGHSLVPASTAVIRRSALEAIGGFQYVPGQCYVDYPTFINLAFEGKFHYFSEIVGYRRSHSASATVQLGDRMAKVAREYLCSLLADPRFALTTPQKIAIEREWEGVQCGQEFALGRLCALQGRWQEAREHFARGLSLSDLRALVGSATGWALSWVKCDLEELFRLAGRAPLRVGQITNNNVVSR